MLLLANVNDYRAAKLSVTRQVERGSWRDKEIQLTTESTGNVKE